MIQSVNQSSLYSTRKILLWGMAFFSTYLSAQDSLIIGQEVVYKDEVISNPHIAFQRSFPNYTETAVQLNTKNSRFNRVQTAESTYDFYFSSKGLFKINPKLFISGNIDFHKIKEKQVGNILLEERTDNQFAVNKPYYYVSRKGDWDKQQYHLRGTIAYQPFSNIVFQAMADGYYDENYRNIDARPKVQNVNYEFAFKAGYTFRKHQLLAFVGYQDFHKDYHIFYENPELNNIITYPDTFLTWNQGYGNNYVSNSTSGIIRNVYKQQGNYLGADYIFYGKSSLLKLSYQNKYSLLKTYDDFILNSNKKELALRTETDKFSVFFRQAGQSKIWETLFMASSSSSINFNYTKQASSNRQINEEVSIKIHLSFLKNNGEITRLGFGAKTGKFSTKDLSVFLDKNIYYAAFSLAYGQDFKLSPKNKFYYNIEGNLYLPLKHKFDYKPYQNVRNNQFIDSVALPDHFYDTSTRCQPFLEFGLDTTKKSYMWRLFVNTSTTFFISNQNFKVPYPFNKQQSITWNIGLKIYN